MVWVRCESLGVPLEEVTLLLLRFWTNEKLPPIVLVQFVYFFKDGQPSTLALEKILYDYKERLAQQQVSPLDDASQPRRSVGIVLPLEESNSERAAAYLDPPCSPEGCCLK